MTILFIKAATSARATRILKLWTWLRRWQSGCRLNDFIFEKCLPDGRRCHAYGSGNLRERLSSFIHIHGQGKIPFCLSPAQISSGDTSGSEASIHGRIRNAKMLGNFIYSPALRSKMFSFFKIPRQSGKMMLLMRRRRHYFQVMDRIIQSVTVFVVHYFIFNKLSSKVLLHDQAMFKALFSYSIFINAKQFIRNVVKRPNMSSCAGFFHIISLTCRLKSSITSRLFERPL